MITAHSKEWLREHLSTIGGTGSTCVENVNRFVRFEEYWHQMKAARAGQVPEPQSSPDLLRGHLLEPIAKTILRNDPNYRIAALDDHDQSEFVYSRAMPWAHALPDGWATHDGIEMPLEVKVPRPETFRKVLLSGITQEYMVQAQHTMAVTDFDRLLFAIMNPVTMDCITQIIPRDWAYTSQLMAKEQAFFASLGHEEPPRPPRNYEEDPLGRPEDDPEIPRGEGKLVVVAPENEQAIAAAYMMGEAWIDRERADEAYKMAKEAYLEHTENAPATSVPGVLMAGYYYTKKGRVTLPASLALARHPDLEDIVKRGKTYQEFRPYFDPEFIQQRR